MHSSIHPLNPSLSLPPSLLSLTLSFSPNFIVRLSDSLEIAPVCLRHFRFSHSSIGSFHHSAGEFGGQKQNHDEWTDLQGIPFLAWWGIVRSINSCESHHPWLTDKIHAPVGCLHSDSSVSTNVQGHATHTGHRPPLSFPPPAEGHYLCSWSCLSCLFTPRSDLLGAARAD
ncbi:uncharacterized protein BO95DRAFT_244511 [Aspergillus brunneoviolaceus CBS 621.78]|uniref:Uncharacterized protein n=1 Tax=Aspergillus brunneoviolaceus CBS 621.78 TaxID=1450534 RepID=A0ACD1GKV5_9EURO|nr:hypothetical protein BO95DRAFT_244511 [Aspergillus brunneoviolaceus CBS 621.78]RAH49773.1 hypothetical protein BO95DRAFT_244511 [Aspergillus brunneoviolaceus CBS 621.78]